jgi:hypothetical protein
MYATVTLQAMYRTVDPTLESQTIMVKVAEQKTPAQLQAIVERFEDLDVARPFYVRTVKY